MEIKKISDEIIEITEETKRIISKPELLELQKQSIDKKKDIDSMLELFK